jgi:hypothetical protein
MPLSVFFGLGGGTPFNDPLSERFNRLNDYNQQVVMREMDMLYELQDPAAGKKE